MLAAEQFYSWDGRENRAIDMLCPALSQAATTGKTVVIQLAGTSLTNAQLVAIAVSLCKRSDSNVAVVGSHHGGTLAFVPLSASPALRTPVNAEPRRARRPLAPAWSASGPVGPARPVTI